MSQHSEIEKVESGSQWLNDESLHLLISPKAVNISTRKGIIIQIQRTLDE